ncbi:MULTISPECIES: C2 family cysteine protease [unclassified Frankia]|uniref:C2 family cysteine protease n=1 Tax=unclassified Frankia TaxID=2632575 RepID=UPI002AD1D057|nr:MULTISPECIES: C2 family cysteine protease [unclassified Frankia]
MPSDESFTPNPDVAQQCGVINPYPLAEVIAGRRIDWNAVTDRRSLLEDLLQTPYEELFDPVHEGPLYTGLQLDSNLRLQQVRSPLLDSETVVHVNDLELSVDLTQGLEVLGDLGAKFGTDDISGIPVLRAESGPGNRLLLTLRVPEKDRLRRLAHVLTADIVRTVSYDPQSAGSANSWTPPGAQWTDAGTFFNEAAEYFDPVQGAVANCYYIAALAAVAWATPFSIRQLTRATGSAQQSFVDMVRFYKPNSGGAVDRDVEVTEKVPLSSGGGFIYCRSSEAGEIWPAVYEKAYAKLKTGTSSDQPDITATAWGDCVFATAQLTGGNTSYYDTASRSGDQLWDVVRSNSLSYRTFRPMTAWTYSTGSASPKKIVYDNTNIVGSHCYTILGWAYRDGSKYLILRNPWGNTEPTVGVLSGTTFMYDISWWRPIALAPNDGTFGIEANTFQTYFAGIGVAA